MNDGERAAPEPGRLLLVLDDEPAIGQLIAEIAEECGFETNLTHDPKTFEARFAARRPDAIILDLVFPGGDGVEEVRFLETNGFEGTLVLISGMDDRVITAARRLGTALGLNVAGALRKPFRPTALRELLGAAASSSGPGQSRAGIASALKNNQFVLYYQPSVDLQTMEPLGVEALARWQHPTRGLLAPDTFIVDVAQSGQMTAFTHWVLDTALNAANTWRNGGHDFRVSINAPASVLREPDIVRRIEDARRRSGDPPSRLLVEVTETEAMGDPVRMMEVLSRLRLAGIDVSIDDFGTGYSSLVELHQMPVSHLKIDKSFVLGCAREHDSAVISRAVIDLAHALELKVVAEGVEDQAIVGRLKEWGCDAAQGYYISRPIPAADLLGWAKDWQRQVTA